MNQEPRDWEKEFEKHLFFNCSLPDCYECTERKKFIREIEAAAMALKGELVREEMETISEDLGEDSFTRVMMQHRNFYGGATIAPSIARTDTKEEKL